MSDPKIWINPNAAACNPPAITVTSHTGAYVLPITTMTTTKVPPFWIQSTYPWQPPAPIVEHPWKPPVTDTFRTEYKALTPMQSLRILQIKTKAQELEGLLHWLPKDSTEEAQMKQAAMRLEECVMWATKAIS